MPTPASSLAYAHLGHGGSELVWFMLILIVPGALMAERRQTMRRTLRVDRRILDGQESKSCPDASHFARMVLFPASHEASG